MSVNDDLVTSPAGLQFIKNWEGYKSRPYLCPAGFRTIGHGTLITELEWNHYMKTPMTREEAHDRLVSHVKKRAEAHVKKLVKVKISQAQFDALVSFVYNLGPGALASSTLLKLLNKGDYDSACAQLVRWNKARDPKTGKLVPLLGLTNRRKAEQVMWKQK